MKSKKVDYNKMVKEMAESSKDYFAEIHESLRRYREIIVPNPTVEDLERYLDQQYPTYRTEPQYIHVPRQYHLEYLRLLVVFDLPEYCRQPEWAFSLFQQAVADEISVSITMLIEAGFKLSNQFRIELCSQLFETIFYSATESQSLPDLTLLKAFATTELFLNFDFSRNDILAKHLRDIFALIDPSYSFEKHLLETVSQLRSTPQ